MAIHNQIVVLILLALGTVGDSFAKDMRRPMESSTAAINSYQMRASGRSTAPQLVLDAFVAAEDRNYLSRPVGRSTITRSLARSLLDFDRHSDRAVVASFGRKLGHQKVLDWYVHSVFLGRRCFGAPSAARAYFAKEIEDLSLAEAAFLAALPKSPVSFEPAKSYDRAVKRRNWVLDMMIKAGSIDAQEAAKAAAEPLVVRSLGSTCSSID